MKEDIIFAGFGGQGIMFMGKAIAHVAMNEGKFVTWMPSYGAEVRGGTAHSMVIISDSLVASPVVKEPTICVAMNKPSFDKFEGRIKKKGLMVMNSSLVGGQVKRKDIEVLKVPATDMAFKLGNIKVSNMIILGALLAVKDFLKLEALKDALTELIPKSRKDLLAINKEAISQGYEYCSR